jgi:hypothetical protein
MDFTTGDVAVRHVVAFSAPINIKHTIDFTPETVQISKVVRNCVIAVAVAWAGVSLWRSWFEYKKAVRKQ